jgi:hypothetical protein
VLRFAGQMGTLEDAALLIVNLAAD